MEIVLRATVVYGVLFVLFRGTRKRALAEMSPFEMILLVTLGDIIQQGITQEDYSLTGAVLAASTFGFWVTVMTWVSYRSARARRVIEGVPLVIVENGVPVEPSLRVEQMPIEEVLEAARQQGIDDLAKVRLGVLETSGRMSFIKYDG
jgi:uncharacterized membrane protein YcaP (DUF421 family)